MSGKKYLANGRSTGWNYITSRQIEQENRTGSSNADGLPSGRMGLALVCEVLRIHEGTVEFLPEENGYKGIRLGWPITASHPPV